MQAITTSTNKIFLLENLRFHNEETKYRELIQNDDENECIATFNALGNVYVNDAFGCCHRDHLSITGSHLREKYYGYLI